MGIVTVTTFTSDTETVTRAKLNGLAANLVTEFNGNIENSNVKATAEISASKLDLSTVAEEVTFSIFPITPSAAPDADYEVANKKYVDDNGILADGTINPTNLLSNGDFESWSAGTSAAPDGWTAGGTQTIARDTGDVGYGSYSFKTTVGQNNAYIRKILTNLKPSATYTISVRTKVTAGDTSAVVTTSAATNMSKTSTSTTWETVTGTFTTDASATDVNFYLEGVLDTDVVWFDGAMLVEGASAFAFSPKPAEEGVLIDYAATSTIVGWAATPTARIYIKKIGKTVFVNVTITGTSNSTEATFTVPYTAVNYSGTMYGQLSVRDNGGTLVMSVVAMPDNSAIVTVSPTLSGGNWTNSGLKEIYGQFFYEAA